MKAESLTRKQFLKTDMKTAWKFFSSPLNLAEITPSWLNFIVMTENPTGMYEGQILQYKVHPFMNLPVWWVTEITHVKEPLFFVDEQRKGPYVMWHHEHHFREENGGVMMTDLVHYILPFSTISQPLIGWFVRRKLDAIFNYRTIKLNAFFNI